MAEVAAAYPRFLDAWAHLGEAARDDVEAYAYFRVGYHRGLDALSLDPPNFRIERSGEYWT